MDAKVFSHEVCELGEAPLWSPERNSLFWVDINRHLVFEKGVASHSSCYDSCWEFRSTPTALARAHQGPEHLWVITDSGLIELNLTTGKQKLAVAFCLADNMRTNDAGVGPDGQLWVGTMQREPATPAGKVFSINSDGELTPQAEHITIPNTFCWSPQGDLCYIADSYQRTLYCVPFPEKMSAFQHYAWQHSDCRDVTYDGGAMDRNGALWIARWGGSRVGHIDPTGETLRYYALPAQQPSSCCFGGADQRLLFVTSATERLTDQQKQAAPDSGKVFVVECQAAGQDLPAFCINSR
ncbi:MAG: SMP-30/gluconolactonase/LRE family protein [Pseudomonadota bacterium]